MDIEVGEYIRTREGLITKLEDLEDLDKDSFGYKRILIWQEDYYERHKVPHIISKHSKNIIDLIEVGDFVNGKRVFATNNRINDNGEKVILAENYDEWTDDGIISNKDIKEILTHEQYNSNCYRLED